MNMETELRLRATGRGKDGAEAPCYRIVLPVRFFGKGSSRTMTLATAWEGRAVWFSSSVSRSSAAGISAMPLRAA